ncbi:MAG: polysaccharide biosynthesis C-terminal domain-containing protein, partial [Lachnospiraceae bacterium]|nr:polysaccharide biosynthesis C-terminal domain-containing protein [Lachnospiraceae bacterium]
ESKKVVGQDISVLQGIYSAKYLKLISVPASIASALSSAIIPAITVNMVKKNIKAANEKIDRALKFTMLIALPCTIGMMVLARPIMLLFGRSTTLIVAVHVLVFGAVNVIFNCISTLTNAILQGLSNMKAPMLHSVVALVIHIGVCIFFLEKGYGIYALLIGTMAFSLVVWILNAIAIYRITGYRKLLGSKLWNIVLASLEMGFVTFCIYQGFFLFLGEGTEFPCLAIALVVAVASYLFFLFLANALTEEDYEMMPMGGRIRSLGLKLHLIETQEQPFEEELGELYEEEEPKPKKQFIFRKQEETTDTMDEVLESEENEITPEALSLLKSLQQQPLTPEAEPQEDGTIEPIDNPVSMGEEQEKPTMPEEHAMPQEDTVAQNASENPESAVTGDTEPINVYEILQKFQKQEQEAAAQLSEVQQSHESTLSANDDYVRDISSADYSQMSLEEIIHAGPIEEKSDDIELLSLDETEKNE